MPRSSLLPLGLLALLCAWPAFSTPQTTPNDPFYGIIRHIKKAPELPVCCLKPAPTHEPAEEFLSFEEWKAKQQQLHAHDKKPPMAAPAALAGSNLSIDSPIDLALIAPVPDSSPSPHFRVPLTDRFNYASLDCSARIHSSHSSAKSPASILSSKKDRYMLSPCSTSQQKFVIVELCEDIRIDTVQLANFEFFSGVFKDLNVSVARTCPDKECWTHAGMYKAKNIRGVQSFHPPTSLRDFYRYIRIDFLSHYGNEYYCPLSLLRVYGLTHLEHWKWDVWEAESRAKRGDSEDMLAAVAASAVDDAQAPRAAVPPTPEAQSALRVEPVVPLATANLQSNSTAELNLPATPTLQHSEGVSPKAQQTADVTPISNGAETAATSPAQEAHAGQQETKRVSSAVPTEPAVATAPVLSSSAVDSAQTPSKVPPVDHTANLAQVPESSHASSIAVPPLNASAMANANSDAPSSPVARPSNAAVVPTPASASTPIPTVIPHALHPAVAVAAASTGESIYRTIMNRLGLLEANSTLYARYVEEQTRSVREALRRLEEDVGRMEGIGKAQAQFFQRTVQEWDRQRKRLDREHGELLAKINVLADEVILEKRLGIAQLCLLLTVLVFMALTRGSRGEAFVPPPGARGGTYARRDSLREWGRRNLSFSSDWVSRFRNRSEDLSDDPLTAKPNPNLGNGKIMFPSIRNDENDNILEPSLRRAPATALAKPRTPSAMRTTHMHRPATPTSVRAVGMRPSSSGGSAGGVTVGRPQLRRSNSHSTPIGGLVGTIGPVPRSARRWARTAHLHEIRVAHSGTREGDGEGHRGRRGDGEVFWPTTPDGKGKRRSRDGSTSSAGVGRVPLTALPLQGTGGGKRLASPWQPRGARPAEAMDLDGEVWVDTDAECSEGGQELIVPN